MTNDEADQAETPDRDPVTGRLLPGHDAGGAPSPFREEFIEQARKLCQLGATDFDLAEFFTVTDRTIRNWKHAHPAFAEALTIGKDIADERVVRSLYHRAVGYTYESEKIFCDKGEVVRASTVEHVPPSDTAAIFWLKNRRRDEWRDSSQIDHSSSDGSMSPQAPVYNITEQ